MRFMEEIKMKGNFWFLHKVNRELYDLLLSAESVSRIDLRQCGSITRDVLEEIISIIKKDNGLERKMDPNLTLAEKIIFFTNEEDLRSIGYLKEEESLQDKPLLPNLGRMQVRYVNGKEKEIDYYDFLRRLGNASSHRDVRHYDVVIDYNHISKALMAYHRLVKKYYENRISKDVPDFQEDYMPIGKYFIESPRTPSDRLRSKCEKEFFGHLVHRNNMKSKYAILRLYKKENIDQEFILRNMETFYRASEYAIQGVPEGMVVMDELIEFKEENTSFYIIVYEFNQKPEKIKETLLKEIDLGNRVKICNRIAHSFNYLHKLDIPIYHRMLSHDSLRLCYVNGTWVPYIIKFDFAKITVDDIKRTMKFFALDAKDKIRTLEIGKYLAPEWARIHEMSDVKWEKVDMYALGVLFRDILAGRIGKAPIKIDDLEKLDISEEFLDLLDIMLADSPNQRPSIDEVMSVLDEEVVYWS